MFEFDLQDIPGSLRNIFFDIVKLPFQFYRMLPEPVRLGITITLFVMAIIIILLAIRSKNRWRRVHY